MAVYYLKTSANGGNDANNGLTSGTAWASLYRASQQTYAAGDILWIGSGTYNETQTCTFRGGGNPSNPVLILAEAIEGPLFHWGTAIPNSPKLVIGGIGFIVQGLRLTQTARGTGAGDRMCVAQRPDGEPNTVVSDITFIRMVCSETYEAFKATYANRIRFIGCSVNGCRIGLGFVGYADRCAAIGCRFENFTDDAIQMKGGSTNCVAARNLIIASAAVNATGITLGGSTTFETGDDWGPKDALYEGKNHVAYSNIIIAPSTGFLSAAIMFRGAHDCRAHNNTIISLANTVDWTSGIGDAFDVTPSAGGGWTNGNPISARVTIENNIAINAAASIETHGTAPTGTNLYRNNTNYLVAWVVTAGELSGAWTFANNLTTDPLLLRAAAETVVANVNAELASGSPALASGLVVAHSFSDGSAHPTNIDYNGLYRGSSTWDRGAYENTPNGANTMANNLTDAAELLVLDWINGVGTPTRPTTPLKVALYTVAPNIETGAGGTEVSGNAYVRQNVTFTAASGGSASNTANIEFPAATASWGTIVAAAVLDSAGSPVMLWTGPVTPSKAIDTGDIFRITAGSLTVSIN